MRFVNELILFGNYFFFFYLLIYVTSLVIDSSLGSFNLFRLRRQERTYNYIEVDYPFPISIIVPVYNENITAIQTISNLLKQDYHHFEIVIVDDGSKDNTKELLIESFKLKLDEDRPIRYQVPCKAINEVYVGEMDGVPIILASKENGGCKADASNAGINICSYPYFVDMDGDEILQRDALKYASRAMIEDDKIIAVGGNIKIANPVTFKQALPEKFNFMKNLVSDMQIIEYGRAFMGARIVQNLFNANLNISGGFGLFKKQAVIEVGGYDIKSLGEDMELVMKLHEYFRNSGREYSMGYVPDSVCWTQAPESLGDLKRQRERWHCGFMQTFWKYKKMILNPKYGAVGLLILPYMIMYELFCSVFILLGWLIIGLSIFMGVFNLGYFILLTSLYLLVGWMLSIGTFISKLYLHNDRYRFVDILYFFVLSIIEALFFRPFLFVTQFLAFFKYSKISKRWVSPKRILVEEQ